MGPAAGLTIRSVANSVWTGGCAPAPPTRTPTQPRITSLRTAPSFVGRELSSRPWAVPSDSDAAGQSTSKAGQAARVVRKGRASAPRERKKGNLGKGYGRRIAAKSVYPRQRKSVEFRSVAGACRKRVGSRTPGRMARPRPIRETLRPRHRRPTGWHRRSKPVSGPLLDRKAQYAALRDEIRPAVDRVLESQLCINGPEVAQLEKEVARYCGCKHAIGVSSGTDALLVALMVLDVGLGDEIITTPYTFFATAGSIARPGARPVCVDIGPATFNIDAKAIEPAVTPRTKAIMPVHLFGQCADMGAIMDVALRHKLPVIEDAAQAIGSEYQGQRAGSIGDIGCFSFFPSKNLGAVGDAGACTTNEDKLARRLVKLRGHGAEVK